MKEIVGFFNLFYEDFSKNKRRKAFYDDVCECTHELFNVSRQEIEDRHLVKKKRFIQLYGEERFKQLRQAASCGLVSLSATELWPQWRDDRDPSWLYPHADYKWDSILSTIGGSIVKTQKAVAWLRENNISPKKCYDWGAGPGFTTLYMARMFPNARFEFNEHPLSPLVKIFSWFKERYGIKNAHYVESPTGDYDLIEALEIVEHFPLIDSKTNRVVKDGNGDAVGDAWTDAYNLFSSSLLPSGYVIWSTVFGAEKNNDVLGHFRVYDINGKRFRYTQTGRHFRKELKDSDLRFETVLKKKFVDGVWIFQRN